MSINTYVVAFFFFLVKELIKIIKKEKKIAVHQLLPLCQLYMCRITSRFGRWGLMLRLVCLRFPAFGGLMLVDLLFVGRLAFHT